MKNGIETFLIVMIINTLSLTLFMYLGNRLLKFFRIKNNSKAMQDKQKFTAALTESKSTNLYKKTRSHPNIICALPIHQAGRSEAPLS